jgi:hypothetical protein
MAEAGPPPAPVAPESIADQGQRRPRRDSMLVGGLLVAVGVILLILQFVRVDVGHYGWPLFVIAPGVVVLILALASRGALGEGLAILGSIITVSGLILLVQNSFDRFESWAYAWPLVFPGAIGAGMILYGLTASRPGNVRVGTRLVGIAVVIFLVGAAFFEGVIWGAQFDRSTGVILGAAIIVAGALMLLLNLASGRRNAP